MDHLLSKEKGKKQKSSSYNKQARWPEHLKQTPTPILLCLVLKDLVLSLKIHMGL